MTDNKNLQVQIWVLVVGFLLLIIKFTAWIITSSNAILSDALESIINVAAGSFTLYSLYLSAKPRDFNHPYGHGKIEFISSGIEGALIFIAGAAIVGKGIYNLIIPEEIEKIDLGLILIIISGIVNFILSRILHSRAHKSHSVALEGEAKHLLSDAYTTGGITIGLAAVWLTGYVFLDSLIAVIFGLMLLRMGIKTVRSAYAGIMDEADFDTLEEIVKIMNDHRPDNWIDIHNFRIIKYGAVLHIDCHLTLPWYYNLVEVHDEIKKLERLISGNTTRQTEMFVHPDPCVRLSCQVCPLQNCDKRKEPFMQRRQWTIEDLVGNKKHAWTPGFSPEQRSE